MGTGVINPLAVAFGAAGMPAVQSFAAGMAVDGQASPFALAEAREVPPHWPRHGLFYRTDGGAPPHQPEYDGTLFTAFSKGLGERELNYLSAVYNTPVHVLEAGLKNDNDSLVNFAIQLLEKLLDSNYASVWTRGELWLLPKCAEAVIFRHVLGWLRGVVKNPGLNDEQHGRIRKSLESKKDTLEKLEALLSRAIADAMVLHPEKVIPEIDIPVFVIEGDELRRSYFTGKDLISAVVKAGGRVVDRSFEGDCLSWFNSQKETDFKNFDSLFNDMLKNGSAVERVSAKAGDSVVYLRFMGTYDDFVASIYYKTFVHGSKQAGDYLNINGKIFAWRHVGIVSRVEGGNIWFQSKWGWGVFETRVDDVSAQYGDHLIFMRPANAETAKGGLEQARFAAQHSQSATELDMLARNPHFIHDPAVQRHLLKNPITPAHVFVKIYQTMNMFDLYNIIGGHEVTEPAKASAREQVRVKFGQASAEECAQFIIRTEGRCLQQLWGERFTKETTDELCKHSYASLILVRNLTIFPALPPALIRHLLKQTVVQRNSEMRTRLLHHANCPAVAKIR